MSLIGLVRVGRDIAAVARQHEALDGICSMVFEEVGSRRHLVANRPDLLRALAAVRPEEALAVHRAIDLANSTIDGLEILDQIESRGTRVLVLDGLAIGTGDRRENVLILSREIAELRRASVSYRIRAGIRAARERGTAHGRPTVVDADTLTEVRALRQQGHSIRAIAHATGVSVGTVHHILKTPTESL